MFASLNLSTVSVAEHGIAVSRLYTVLDVSTIVSLSKILLYWKFVPSNVGGAIFRICFLTSKFPVIDEYEIEDTPISDPESFFAIIEATLPENPTPSVFVSSTKSLSPATNRG